jgi:hypothetical protein
MLGWYNEQEKIELCLSVLKYFQIVNMYTV